MRPFPSGLAPQRWGLGTPEPQRQSHPATKTQYVCIGSPPLIQDGRRAGPSKHLVTFEGSRAKTLRPTLPLPSALTLVRPSARRTAFGSGLPASWGLTLTLGLPPRDPSQGVWLPIARDWVT